MTQPPSDHPAQPGPGADVLAVEPSAPVRGRRRGVLIGASVLAVALVGGGAALAASKLGGGGAQPDEAVPASAVGFVAVDLDPSAGQKVDFLRFARKFPDARKAIGSDDDVRKALFESLKKDGRLQGDWSRDVAPWLGDRAGFAVLPPKADGEDPGALVVLAVTDAGKAKAGIAKVSEGQATCEFPDGWAVCSDDAAVVSKAVKDAADKPLSQAKDYTADVEALGERGVARAWFDLGKLQEAIPTSGQVTAALSSAKLTGRTAFALRFDGPTLELAGHATGTQLPKLSGSAGVDDLPADSVAVYGFSGADRLVDYAYAQVRKAAESMNGAAELDALTQQVQQQFGISVPGDVTKAIGDRMAIVYGGQDAGAPQVAARFSGDRGTLDTIVNAVQGGAGLTLGRAQSGSDSVLASTQAYADKVAGQHGLGDSAAFKDAVPHAKDAQAVLYVDIAAALSQSGDQAGLSAAEREQAKALQSLGLSVTQDGDRLSYDVRLTTK
ncbi:MAG TPA: DUF3352 domain-containing protein [Angustibacter sp.]|nr:DUF3352 domain-containing protein [Angustibacter sp.]